MNKILNKIEGYLIFYSHRLRDVRLFRGKTGIGVALTAYAKKNNADLLKDFTWILHKDAFTALRLTYLTLWMLKFQNLFIAIVS